MGTLIDNRITRPLAFNATRRLGRLPIGRRLINVLHNGLSWKAQEVAFWRLSGAFRGVDTSSFSPGTWYVPIRDTHLKMPLSPENYGLDWSYALGALGHDAAVKETYRRFLATLELSTFVDVGANVGVHSALMASCGLRVIALEPNTSCDYWADRIKNLNKLGWDRRAVAAGGVRGSVILTYPEHDTSLGTLNPQVADRLSGGGITSVEVPVITIDDLELSDPGVLIKIDVEGFELEVLQGSLNTLNSVRPYLIFESNPGDDRRGDVFDLLMSSGYEILSAPQLLPLSSSGFLTSRAGNFAARPAQR